VEHVAYNAFQSAVDNCVDPDCRRALKALADLFALRCIEQDVIFRNDEYVAPAKVRGVEYVVKLIRSRTWGCKE
jgi:acyl-CoA oxidase